jgi:DNA-binding LytR/AlgR family response regulator
MKDYFFIHSNKKYERINFSELVYINAKVNYIEIVMGNGIYLTLNTMETAEKYLPHDLFCRIRRSYIVSISRIKALDNNTVWLCLSPHEKKYTERQLKVKALPTGGNYRRILKGHIEIMQNRRRSGKRILEKTEFVLL